MKSMNPVNILTNVIFQAIQHPTDERLQEKAWGAVVPLVGKLKKFYEFSQRLGKYQYIQMTVQFLIIRTVLLYTGYPKLCLSYAVYSNDSYSMVEQGKITNSL